MDIAIGHYISRVGELEENCHQLDIQTKTLSDDAQTLNGLLQKIVQDVANKGIVDWSDKQEDKLVLENLKDRNILLVDIADLANPDLAENAVKLLQEEQNNLQNSSQKLSKVAQENRERLLKFNDLLLDVIKKLSQITTEILSRI